MIRLVCRWSRIYVIAKQVVLLPPPPTVRSERQYLLPKLVTRLRNQCLVVGSRSLPNEGLIDAFNYCAITNTLLFLSRVCDILYYDFVCLSPIVDKPYTHCTPVAASVWCALHVSGMPWVWLNGVNLYSILCYNLQSFPRVRVTGPQNITNGRGLTLIVKRHLLGRRR
jgi:hypothetical protein